MWSKFDDADPLRGPAVPAVLQTATALRKALDASTDAAMWQLTQEEVHDLAGQLGNVQSGLSELMARVVAGADRRDLPTHDGAPSLTDWLRLRTKVTGVQAAAMTRHAKATAPDGDDRALWRFTGRAWAAGTITADQAVAITTALDKLSDEVPMIVKRAAERDLVERAKDLQLEQTRRLANHVVEVVDPDGADAHLAKMLADEEARARQHTRFAMSRLGDGTTRGSFRLPDAQADLLKPALDAIAAPRRPSAPRPTCASTTPTATVSPTSRWTSTPSDPAWVRRC